MVKALNLTNCGVRAWEAQQTSESPKPPRVEQRFQKPSWSAEVCLPQKVPESTKLLQVSLHLVLSGGFIFLFLKKFF